VTAPARPAAPMTRREWLASAARWSAAGGLALLAGRLAGRGAAGGYACAAASACPSCPDRNGCGGRWPGGGAARRAPETAP
jgi:hypothetical protein